jgi:hypothetical protein
VQLDDDVFDLSVVFQGVNAHFPAKPALFVASERCGGIEDIVAVHPHSTSLKSLGDFVCLVDVLRPHAGRQAITESRSSKGAATTTGPKISSATIFMSGLTFSKTVGAT